MDSIEELSDRIAKLPEIEFQELMEKVAEHCYKNKLDHAIRQAFEIPDAEELEESFDDRVEDMKREHEIECDMLRDDIRRLEKYEDIVTNIKQILR